MTEAGRGHCSLLCNMTSPPALIRRLDEVRGTSPLGAVRIEDVFALRDSLSRGENIWEGVSDGVSLEAVAGTLERAMCEDPGSHDALFAASVYIALLASPGCPTFSLFKSLGFTAALRTLKVECSKNVLSDTSSGCHEGTAGTAHTASDILVDVRCIVLDIAAFLRIFSLRNMPEIRRSVLELLSETAVTPLAVSTSTGEQSSTALIMEIFEGLLQPSHGDALQTVMILMNQLVPILLGSSSQGTHARDQSSSANTAKLLAIRLVQKVVSDHEVALPAVAASLRYLALRCDERASVRSCVVDVSIAILSHLPLHEVEAFTTFIVKLSRNSKSSKRLLATELALNMLQTLPDPYIPGRKGASFKNSFNRVSESSCTLTQLKSSDQAELLLTAFGFSCSWGAHCSALLMKRASDKAPTIRAKALQGIANTFQNVPISLLALASGKMSVEATNSVGLSLFQCLADVKLTTVLQHRCRDEKAAVRKPAIAALETVVIALKDCDKTASIEILSTIARACTDNMVSVRRQALYSLNALLRVFPENRVVISVWLKSVLPMIDDVESSLQERCLDGFQEFVISGIMPGEPKLRDESNQRVSCVRSQLLVAYLGSWACPSSSTIGRLVTALHKRGALNLSLMRVLQKIVVDGFHSADERPEARSIEILRVVRGKLVRGAWSLLAEVMVHLPHSADWEFLRQQWSDLVALGDQADGLVCRCVLSAVSHAASQFPAVEAEKLALQLQQRIAGFNLAHGVAAAHLGALTMLKKIDADHIGQRGVPKWFDDLCDGASAIFRAYIRSSAVGVKSPSLEKLAAAIFLTGEISFQCKRLPRLQCQTFLQTIVVPKLLTSIGLIDVNVPNCILAHAWTALGKLCLVSETLAKSCLPLFCHSLNSATAPEVRNNILIVLIDLCVCYTALVDPYILRLTVCLRDNNELVRRQSLSLLASLLQQDYLKWRGTLFKRFLVSLVDCSPVIARLARCLLTETVASKCPLLPYNHFIEALFALNNFKPQSTVETVDTDGRALFSIEGSDPTSRARRAKIYSLLLQHMSPEHRLATAAKLVTEVLTPVTEDILPLQEPPCGEVLVDALWILSSQDMKLHSIGKVHVAEDDDIGLSNGVTCILRGAKRRLVSSLAKKNLLEHVVPAVIKLKRLLEARQSPYLGKLTMAILSILKDYQAELDDILATDKQLARELAFEFRRDKAITSVTAVGGPLRAWQPEGLFGCGDPDTSVKIGFCSPAEVKHSQDNEHEAETPITPKNQDYTKSFEFAGVDSQATPEAAAALVSATPKSAAYSLPRTPRVQKIGMVAVAGK